jgi:pyruvate,water dikinase
MPEPGAAPPEGLRLYLSANFLQGFTQPFSPLGIEFFGLFVSGIARIWGFNLEPGTAPPVLKQAALRIYVDIAGGLRHPFTRRLVRLPAKIVDRQMERIVDDILERERRLDPDGRRRPLRVRPSAGLWLLSRLVVTAFAPDRARDWALRNVWNYVGRLEAAAEQLHGVEERVRFVRTYAPTMVEHGLAPLATVVFPGVGMRFLAESKVAQWLGDASLLQPVFRGLSHNPTTEMDLELWQVSRQLAAEGAAPRADHPAVAAFLKQYGHRGVREIDLGMPRWRDDPAHVLGVLETYLARGAEADAEAHFRAGAAAAEQSAAELVRRVRREKGPVKAWALRWVLKRFRALGGTREYPKFFMVKVISIHRRVLQGAGAELVAAGRLDHPDDVFYLRHLSDLLDPGADLRGQAAAGRAEYRREMERRAVPRVITSEGEAFYGAPAPAVPGALAGTAASPGIYEGMVRVVHDPTNAKLAPGEVLVAPGTDPAWTPLFLAAGALVMEVGGVMSHGSEVAREYGIPAVVGVAGATEQLKTGQRVRVDGEAGVVVPL